MKITVGSRILKIVLKVLMVWTVVSPLLTFYEPYLRMIHLDHLVLWQKLAFFAAYVAMSLGMAYILSLCIGLVNSYQRGEFFTAASSALVKQVIYLFKWYLFIAVFFAIGFQWFVSQPITIGGITAPQFGFVSVISSAATYLIQYAVLTMLGRLHARECRAREEANLTV